MQTINFNIQISYTSESYTKSGALRVEVYINGLKYYGFVTHKGDREHIYIPELRDELILVPRSLVEPEEMGAVIAKTK